MAISVQSTGNLELDAQNQAVIQWQSMVQTRLRGETRFLKHGKEGTISRPGRTERKLSDSIRIQNRRTYGVITGASFVFERHGVFVQKGVGRGYEAQGKGMVVRTAKSSNPVQMREPYDWFNSSLNQSLPELADRLANINADAVINASGIMIK